jgi:hypothetical protein
MQHDNNHTHQIDQQLRELEQYSLPDLSKQDDHWKSMAAMIGTASAPGTSTSKGFIKTTWKWIAGIGAVGITVVIILLLKSRSNVESEHEPVTQEIPVTGKDTIQQQQTADTTGHPVDTLKTSIAARRDNHHSNDAVLDALYDRMEKKGQYFTISNHRDTVLYGHEGTILTIPAGSFDTNGDVMILLQEFYSIKDMIGNLLYTKTTDGRQLVSGGMLYIEAMKPLDAYVPVKLMKGASIRLDMPKTDDKPMNLFYGRVQDGDAMPDITWDVTDLIFSPLVAVGKNKKRSRAALPVADGDGWPIADQKEASIDPILSMLSPKKDTPTARRKATSNNTLPQGDSIYALVGDTTATGNTIGTLRVKAVSAPPRVDTIRVSSTAPVYNNDRIVLNDQFETELRNTYGVDLRALGWINCDRFYNEPGPKVNFYVEVDKPAAIAYTYLVFDRFKSILPATITRGSSTITFSNIPANEKVQVICVGAENGKLLTVTQPATTTATPLKLAFKENTAAGFVKSIAARPSAN